MKVVQFFNKPIDLTLLLVKNRWIWHVSFWMLYAFSRLRNYYITVLYYPIKYIEFMLVVDFSIVFVIYFTNYIFKKHFVHQNYMRYYVLGLLWWLVFLVLIITFQKNYLKSLQEINNISWSNLFFNNLSYYLLQFVLVTMALYFKNNYIKQYYDNAKRQEQMSEELNNLKAQIAPHFLFNTMNNFYGLAVENSTKLPALMVKLSQLLRYSLYETNAPNVALHKEIEYIKNYISLEKIRLEENLDFSFITNIKNEEGILIAPLLFIGFIENAFKHAKSVRDEAVKIRINITIDEQKNLFFFIENNCLLSQVDFEKNIGIGIDNVKKRLSVLYPDSMHLLKIETIENFFRVNLKINLN